MSLTGCQHTKPAPLQIDLARAVICGSELSREQWASYNAAIQIAKIQGDPYNLKPILLKVGAILKKCEPNASWER